MGLSFIDWVFVRDSAWQIKRQRTNKSTSIFIALCIHQRMWFQQPRHSNRVKTHLSRSHRGNGPLSVHAVVLRSSEVLIREKRLTLLRHPASTVKPAVRPKVKVGWGPHFRGWENGKHQENLISVNLVVTFLPRSYKEIKTRKKIPVQR